MIKGSTGLVGLLGNPVKHSLSPVMQNAALDAMGLDWRYLAFPCEESQLRIVLEGMHAVNCRGLNVTIPHKQSVANICAELSPLAERLGAVNTLLPLAKGGWHGTNTDVEGFLAPLGKRELWQGKKAVVIGCGGSARAVVAGLQTLQLQMVHVIGRRAEVLNQFVADLQQADAPLHAITDQDPNLRRVIEAADLVVNTTPVGMAQHGDPSAMPLGNELWEDLSPRAIVYDLIYTPRPTAWLAQAADRGHLCFDGLEMLVQQGASALRLWSGQQDVPVPTMRLAAEAALGT